MKALAILMLASSLTGCASSQRAASVAGACGAFRPAPYAIEADTRQGQVWVNGTIETQHRVCSFPRPGNLTR